MGIRLQYDDLKCKVSVVERFERFEFSRGEVSDGEVMNPTYAGAVHDYDRHMGMAQDGFNLSSRVHISGFKLDQPKPEKDDKAGWAICNAAEKALMVEILRGQAPSLAKRGVMVSTDEMDYVGSLYAGCALCTCSPGLIARRAYYAKGSINPVNIYIEIK
jgi:hypothetical protein